MSDARYTDALLFASGFYFGLRIGDILRLRWKDVKGEKFTLHEGKTGKTREIQIHSDYKKLVRSILAKIEPPPLDGYVFEPTRKSDRKGQPMSVISANRRIQKAFDRYAIPVQNPSSHTLRKTFGRRVYENNDRSEAALILLSQIFNHRDTSTTRRYIGLTQEKISNAYLSL